MNKAQDLDVMIMRAKIRCEEIMAQHNVAWNAKEAKEMKEGENAEGMDAGLTGQVQTREPVQSD